MNKTGSMALTSAIALITAILLGVVAVSVLSDSTTSTNSEQDLIERYNQIIDESVDEISTYIKITDRLGKYYGGPQKQKIEKIALMIKPLVSIDIDLSELTIEICNGKDVRILSFNGETDKIGSKSLFDHYLWDKIKEDCYSFIVTHDKDNSIIDYKTINKNSDMGFIIIKLPDDFQMKKGGVLLVSIFPGTGITRNIALEAPLPIKSVVSLD